MNIQYLSHDIFYNNIISSINNYKIKYYFKDEILSKINLFSIHKLKIINKNELKYNNKRYKKNIIYLTYYSNYLWDRELLRDLIQIDDTYDYIWLKYKCLDNNKLIAIKKNYMRRYEYDFTLSKQYNNDKKVIEELEENLKKIKLCIKIKQCKNRY